jgi:phage repressor protein C with HTH and peptisase S24 domain
MNNANIKTKFRPKQIIMDKISTIKENILYFIEKQCVSKVSFYEKTGISASNFKGTGLKSEIGGDKIVKILTYYPEISPEWLLTGKGSMLRSELPIALPIQESDAGIPFVSVTAIGGFGSVDFAIQQEDIKEYYVIPKFKHKKIDFMIEVEGSSMYPKYNSGDVVACTVIKESSFIQWNKTHVVATKEQGIIIKRLKKSDIEDNLIMISDNKSYEPFEVNKKDITGIALVVGVIRLE